MVLTRVLHFEVETITAQTVQPAAIKTTFFRYVAKNAYFCIAKCIKNYEEIYLDCCTAPCGFLG